MTTAKHYIKKYWVSAVLLILIFLLIIAIGLFIHSFQSSYSEGALHPIYRPPREDSSSANLPLQNRELTINDIQPWMTFNYVNVVFKLPPTYLKNILGISNSRYPNIRIDTYAKETKFNELLLMQTIKKYVTTYTSY